MANENETYARENRFLREIVEYHQLTMQDLVYVDENMEEVIYEGEELLARAFCHEIDHLDGHLYVEKVEGELHDAVYEEEEIEEE